MDFATSILPGWHTTIFPPYFVAGAVFSGFGMVLTAAHHRAVASMNLQRYITLDHLDRMAKIMLLTGSLVAFSYVTEWFTAWYGSNPDERFAFVNRATGPYAWAFWTMVACNVVVPQLLWLRRVRASPAGLLAIAILINVGMWFERFVIIVTSLHRSYLPSSWVMYTPDGHRGRHAGGKLRAVLFLFSPLHPAASHDRHVGGQGPGRRAAVRGRE